jgi:UDP-N-acetylglucosamine 2-epimerase (non-hydrolysing)
VGHEQHNACAIRRADIVKRVLSIIGTRPEAIKMAPVVLELSRYREQVKSIVCLTGQHREMLAHVLGLFSIIPDVALDVMQPDQRLSDLSARLLQGLDPVVAEQRPDWILAQGDTTTVLAAALMAYYHKVPFGHVEAGLRTGDPYRPFPEEVNRRVADVIAQLLFAPTQRSRQALLREGQADSRIVVTGNTVIDALLTVASMPYDWEKGPLAGVPRHKRVVLVTAHRRESFGGPLEDICRAVREIAERFGPEDVHLVYPVHLNPNVRRPVERLLAGARNITLLEPLDYLSLVNLMKCSTLILTDSGGIQEEAPALCIPVLVMRDTTERPEGIEAGVVKLVGTQRQRIVGDATRLLTDPTAYRAMATGANPYGDGKAAQRIVSAVLGASH